MKRYLSIAVTIIISLVMTDRASGGFMNGNELYADCTSSKPDDLAACVSYVEGVIDAGATQHSFFVEAARQGSKAPPPKGSVVEGTVGIVGGSQWCLRKTVKARQAVDAVVAFLRNNPADRDASASSLVAVAAEQAWPCSND